ncbi:MAG: alkaline phosphatase [Bacteroidales bacterium]|nr:alkaline phosphatase [Bacteroidales bacterium]
MKRNLIFSLALLLAFPLFAQTPEDLDRDRSKYATYSFSKDDQYTVETPYETVTVKQPKSKKVKNVIFLIGDGTGLSQWSVGWVANGGKLNIDQMPVVGFSRTYCTDRLVTDSCAGGKDGGSITHKVSLSDSYAVNVARGKMLPLGDITSHLKTYTPPAEADHVSSIDFASATDLSATATANSYIVTAAGKYKIKLVKGNSSDSVGEVNGQELLWETYNTDETVTANSVIAALDRHIDGGTGDRYLVFETPATLKPGNALIAAKDASDNILWSWHIWIPETAITMIDDADFYTAKIMDRNLGALTAATASSATLPTYGMYYQWGRKDPFPGSAVSTGSFSTVSGPLANTYAIQHPTAFINVSESDSAGNWSTDGNDTAWDNSGSKGLYDPCPVGYKVPAYNASTGLWVNDNTGWTYNWANNNFLYGSSVFPVAGWLSSSYSPSYVGARAIILSSTVHSSPRGRLKIIRQDKSGFYYANYFKQEGASVRCVAE